MSRRPFLETLSVIGFRSLGYDVIDFSNPTILVGKNGAGKSNVIDLIAFLAECATTPLPFVFERRGGVQAVLHRPTAESVRPSLTVAATVRLSDRGASTGEYQCRLLTSADDSVDVSFERCLIHSEKGQTAYFERNWREFRSDVAGLKPRLERDALALPIVGGVEEFAPLVTALADMRVYSIDPAQMGTWQDPDAGKRLRSDGSNIASVLQRMVRQRKESVERIGELLAAVVPGITRVRPVKHGKKLTLEFTQEWEGGGKLSLEAESMSDGTLRILGILAAVRQHPSPSLIAIEEPEVSVHPGALGLISDMLEIAAQRTQVVVTTQSPDLLDAKWIQPEHLRLVAWEKGATHILPVAPHTVSILKELLMGAGELLRANALDAAPIPVDEPRKEMLATPG